MITLPPQGYLEMLGLMADARVLTDSGGLREEKPPPWAFPA